MCTVDLTYSNSRSEQVVNIRATQALFIHSRGFVEGHTELHDRPEKLVVNRLKQMQCFSVPLPRTVARQSSMVALRLCRGFDIRKIYINLYGNLVHFV